MGKMRLTDKADLGVFYEADAGRWDPEHLRQLGITKEMFIDFYAGCPSVGFEIDGKPVGGIIFDGVQAHIAVLPEYYGRWALLFKPALEWLFTLKEPIYIDIETENERCLRFMDRNQWPRVRADDKTVTFEVTRNTPVLTGAWKSSRAESPEPAHA